MNEYFSVCSTVMYQRRYLDFLLKHYEDLNLPYSFHAAFSFIASPVMMGQESLLCFDEDNEVVGAFGYIHGTGEKNYEDRQVLQVQVVYLVESHRCTSLFLRGLQFLANHLAELNEDVSELVFWTKPDAYSKRLFGKLGERTSVQESAVGALDAYRLSLTQLKVYLAGHRRRELA